MDIHSTRAMRGANCWTDHQMLRSKLAFRIRQRHSRQGTSKPTKLNIKKTEALYQPNSTRTREEDIMVDGNKLNSVLEFTYLGSTISSDGCIDDEIQRRMAKASASFGRLRQRLWNNHHVSMRVKGKINLAIVLSTLLYGAEAWTVYR